MPPGSALPPCKSADTSKPCPSPLLACPPAHLPTACHPTVLHCRRWQDSLYQVLRRAVDGPAGWAEAVLVSQPAPPLGHWPLAALKLAGAAMTLWCCDSIQQLSLPGHPPLRVPRRIHASLRLLSSTPSPFTTLFDAPCPPRMYSSSSRASTSRLNSAVPIKYAHVFSWQKPPATAEKQRPRGHPPTLLDVPIALLCT